MTTLRLNASFAPLLILLWFLFFFLPTLNRVTLKDRERKMAENRTFIPDLLVFLKVPRTGSSLLTFVIRRLNRLNRQMTSESFKGRSKKRMTRQEQRDLIQSCLSLSPRPALYARHFHFVDFRLFPELTSGRMPVFFSGVRDPVTRFLSYYDYQRFVLPGLGDFNFRKLVAGSNDTSGLKSLHEWRSRDVNQCILQRDHECWPERGWQNEVLLAIPYFCGQDPRCMELQSPWALNEAKRHVEQWFPVVGVLEHLNDTLRVMERVLPAFFQGIQQFYHETMQDEKRYVGSAHSVLNAEAESLLKSQLTLEYEFYDYICQRLRQQHSSIL